MGFKKFDRLFFSLILAMLFCIGYHIGSPEEESKPVSFTAEVSYEKLSGDPVSEGVLKLDGTLPVYVSGFDGEIFYISMEGRFCEAGFLLGKSKYLSANQPVFLYGELSGIEGKIIRLYPT